jgi:hypothetical protein
MDECQRFPNSGSGTIDWLILNAGHCNHTLIWVCIPDQGKGKKGSEALFEMGGVKVRAMRAQIVITSYCATILSRR